MIQFRKLILGGLFVFTLYMGYITTEFFINKNEMQSFKQKPLITLNKLVDIKGDRVSYISTYFVKNKFVGFEALIDSGYLVKVIKIGKVRGESFKIIKLKRIESKTSDFFPFFNDNELFGESSSIEIQKYPFTVSELYYSTRGGKNLNILSDNFLEMNLEYNFINFSFENLGRVSNLAFSSIDTNLKSISFIEYNNELYILKLSLKEGYSFKSLHELIKN